jgi:cytochrome c oxidase subunit 1/cytochrome c oxidase subunit I+III
VHLPTVITRHPLWDSYEEEEDPRGERVLDQDRLTFSTTWLDAEPLALSRIQEDTILPLLLAIGFFVIFGAITFQLMWVVVGALVYSFIIAAVWFWPKPQEGELEGEVE